MSCQCVLSVPVLFLTCSERATNMCRKTRKRMLHWVFFCSPLKTIQNYLDLEIIYIWWHMKGLLIPRYITEYCLNKVPVGSIKPHTLLFVTITCHHMSSPKIEQFSSYFCLWVCRNHTSLRCLLL